MDAFPDNIRAKPKPNLTEAVAEYCRSERLRLSKLLEHAQLRYDEAGTPKWVVFEIAKDKDRSEIRDEVRKKISSELATRYGKQFLSRVVVEYADIDEFRVCDINGVSSFEYKIQFDSY